MVIIDRMIDCQRKLFDIPDDVAYFNCAYLSPLLNSVVAAGELGVRQKAHPWNVTAPDFFDDVEILRQLFARILGIGKDGVAIIPSASYGIAIAAQNVAVSAGQNIVLIDEQFPSNVYVWRSLAQRKDASVVTVKQGDDGNWTQQLLRAIDETTAVVAIPNVHWTDGALIDLDAVAAKTREHGAALVLDLTQSVGAMPTDVSALDPDFAICSGYKWLLGPYSLSYMYAAPRHYDGVPIEFSWMNRLDAEDFTGLVLYRDELQDGARRYDVGEKSNFALVPMGITALSQLLEWGIHNIADTLGKINVQISERVAELGFELTEPENRAPHLMGMRVPGGIPGGFMSQLAAQKVFVSQRGDSIRLAPHVFVSQTDIDRLIKALQTLAS